MSYPLRVLRRVVIAGGVVVLALLGHALWQVAFPSPEAAVRRYFDALEARNPGAAFEELADHQRLVQENNRSAMWSAMSDARYQPPTGARTGGWQHAPAAGGERVVAVQFELAGVTHNVLLKLRRIGGQWRITNGMGTVEANIAAARVNGTRMSNDKHLQLFPGIYELSGNPSASLLTAASPVTAVVTPGKVGAVVLATTLAMDAPVKIKQRMDELVKACEKTAVAWKTDCPFRVSEAVGLHQVKWTMVNLPELTVTQSGPDTVTVKGVGPGSVRLNAVDAAGASIDRVDSFSVDGKCVEVDGMVSCTFSA